MYRVVYSDYNSTFTRFIDYELRFDSFVKAITFCRNNQNYPITPFICAVYNGKVHFSKLIG